VTSVTVFDAKKSDFKYMCACENWHTAFKNIVFRIITRVLFSRTRLRTVTYNLLNSSNKRACSNTFVHVTLVSSTHNNGQKLQENFKSDTRKLLKHFKKIKN